MKLIQMTGLRFGRLLVLEKSRSPRMWVCACDCGAEKLVSGSNLRNGSIRSCGCLASEWAAKLGANPDYIAKRSDAMTRHGHKRRDGITPEYRTWLGMKRRCFDVTYKDYATWGGRGIVVCDRWNDSFDAFLADMGLRPTHKSSIDRIDPNGAYCPENCRWATPLEQGETKRSNIPVVVGGRKFESLAAACRHFGVNVTAASERIRAGICIETAVSHAERLPPRRTRESYLRKDRR